MPFRIAPPHQRHHRAPQPPPARPSQRQPSHAPYPRNEWRMAMRRVLLASLCLWPLTANAQTSFAEAARWCTASDASVAPESRIAGCTWIICSGQAGTRNRSIAYNWRGNHQADTGDRASPLPALPVGLYIYCKSGRIARLSRKCWIERERRYVRVPWGNCEGAIRVGVDRVSLRYMAHWLCVHMGLSIWGTLRVAIQIHGICIFG